MPAKYTPEQQIEAFWSKVDQSAGPDGCWLWMASRHTDGYGQVWWNGCIVRAHRIAYILAHGPIPPDKPCVLHKCDCRLCVNPAHLFAGTRADNSADMVAKGRSATGKRHGSRTKPESRARGERNSSAKLTAADIPSIRAALAAKESKTSIARRYGVTFMTIHAIAIGKSWAYVP